MEKYKYQLPVKQLITNQKNGFEKQGLSVDTRYIENYNICPRCKTEMKTYRGEIIGVSSISAFLIMEKKLAVIYGLCKSCAKKVMKASYPITDDQENIETEKYIFSKFPDLKPIKDGCDEEGLKEQLDIFKKL